MLATVAGLLFGLLFGLLLACEAAPADGPPAAYVPPPTAEPTVEPTAEADVQKTVVLTLHQRQDSARITAAVGAIRAQPDPLPTVEIRLDADQIDGLTLQLGSVSDSRLLDLVVVGRSGGTVLHSSRISLAGRSVSVSGLSFVGRAPAGDSLSVAVTGRATLDHLGFVDHAQRLVPSTRRRGARIRGAALALQAMGRQATAVISDLAVADCTLSPAVSISAQPGGRFAEFSLSDASFSAVTVPAIDVGATVKVNLRGVASDADQPLLHTDSAAVLVDGQATALSTSDARVAAVRNAARPVH
ncbi:MAG: hypothetical protein GXP62_04340 [Oligoflexia bacterium]|nr:hypothetical protein [Oligoflexia bacterium]